MTFKHHRNESRAAPRISLAAVFSFVLAFASLAVIAIIVATRFAPCPWGN